MTNSAIGGTWDELEREIFTPEEIAASDLRVKLIGELIKEKSIDVFADRELALA